MKRLVLLSLLFALTAGAVAQTNQTLQSGSTLQSVLSSAVSLPRCTRNFNFQAPA